ncbi:hypothetical protein [Agrobacterium larrymoorei]|uniref:Uncharacterized protein n=2 Tax=Agrobacterium TaxID=357 RepID=A0A4D7DMH5_9HYPH|nr:hypothetical protein [Agrobacterium larrymoorei]QCI97258.1 hypothetical protein CFBP5473_04585 [Agrobacterium larrymoorei]QYA07310.1 hypothetical protein J5285_00820 [Agrobacterium larrymoorei]
MRGESQAVHRKTLHLPRSPRKGERTDRKALPRRDGQVGLGEQRIEGKAALARSGVVSFEGRCGRTGRAMAGNHHRTRMERVGP